MMGFSFCIRSKFHKHHFWVDFSSWGTRVFATLHNGTYTQSDWYSRKEQKRAA